MSEYLPLGLIKWLIHNETGRIDLNIIRKCNLDVFTLEFHLEYQK